MYNEGYMCDLVETSYILHYEEIVLHYFKTILIREYNITL